MRFLIIGHSKHKKKEDAYFGYMPYVREMNLWLKHVDEVEIVAPTVNAPITPIDAPYEHPNIQFSPIPSIEFTSLKQALISVFVIPGILYTISKACRRADHIHLRCPGNIGLLGCIVQLLFPSKIKTAKYAGNWDPKASQPVSYRIQKRILNSTTLTKNMTVLVYGKWENQSDNIKPFFTASFHDRDKGAMEKRDYDGLLRFIFVGSLVPGKRPMLAVHIVHELHDKGISCRLDLYGDGQMMNDIKAYISQNNLETIVTLHGNVSAHSLKEVLKSAHFLILPSRSEGWPKAIAEAMFFGVIPIATSVSCVPEMLGDGTRGIIIEAEREKAVKDIEKTIGANELEKMSSEAAKWSQQYTLEYMEAEIKKLL